MARGACGADLHPPPGLVRPGMGPTLWRALLRTLPPRFPMPSARELGRSDTPHELSLIAPPRLALECWPPPDPLQSWPPADRCSPRTVPPSVPQPLHSKVCDNNALIAPEAGTRRKRWPWSQRKSKSANTAACGKRPRIKQCNASGFRVLRTHAWVHSWVCLGSGQKEKAEPATEALLRPLSASHANASAGAATGAASASAAGATAASNHRIDRTSSGK